jgi:serine/threonine protein kinase
LERGMGEVYRARDARLNRDVAIKVSGEQFSQRFESEAKAIAALNHPNICQIYDVGRSSTVNSRRPFRRMRRCNSRGKLLPRSRPHTARGLFIATSNQRTSSRLRAGL